MTEPSTTNPRRRVVSRSLVVLGFLMVACGLFVLVTFLQAINRDYLDVELRAVDPQSGETVWIVSQGGTERPVMGSKVVLIVTGAGVDAIDTRGELAWRFHDGRAHHAQVSNGMAIVSTRDGWDDPSVVVVDEASGGELWRAKGSIGRVAIEDSLASLRRGRQYEIVDLRTGGSLARLDDDARDVTVSRDVAAFLAGRTLGVVTRDDGERTLASGLRRSPSIIALADDVVVVRTLETRDGRDGPRQRLLTAFDVATGDVRWQHRVDNYRDASHDEMVLRLDRASGPVEIDLVSGRRRAPAGESAGNRSPDRAITIEQVERAGSHGQTDYFVTNNVPYFVDVRSTIALDAVNGDVHWVREGELIASGDGMAVVKTDPEINVIAAAEGTVLATLPRRARTRAAVVDDLAVVVSGGTITTVGTDGVQRTLASGLDRSSRIVGVAGDVLVLHHSENAGRRTRRIFTAHDLGSGEAIWSHEFRGYRNVTVAGDSLVVSRSHKVTTIDLPTGAAQTVEQDWTGGDADVTTPPLTAIFDASMNRLLWTSDFPSQGADTAELVGDVVVMVRLDNRDP